MRLFEEFLKALHISELTDTLFCKNFNSNQFDISHTSIWRNHIIFLVLWKTQNLLNI